MLVTAFLGAIRAGNEPLTFVLGVALAGVVYSMPNAVWPATYAEYFPTSVRLSGMAVGTSSASRWPGSPRPSPGR